MVFIPHTRSRDVNVTKMLSVVVLLLSISHSVGLVDFLVTRVVKVVYREFLVINILVVTLNAAGNFYVYNKYSKDFNRVFTTHIRSKFSRRDLLGTGNGNSGLIAGTRDTRM